MIDNLNESWNYEVKRRVQSELNDPSSMLQGKILTKISFTIKNRKHVWRKTIEKMPNPLDPIKTVLESDIIISKYKNHVTLTPKTTFMVGK